MGASARWRLSNGGPKKPAVNALAVEGIISPCLRAQVGQDGRISNSRWCLGGLDAVPIEAVLPPGAALLPTTTRDWQVG